MHRLAVCPGSGEGEWETHLNLVEDGQGRLGTELVPGVHVHATVVERANDGPLAGGVLQDAPQDPGKHTSS